MIIDALRRNELFAGLTDDDLARLATMVEPVKLRAGEFLLREGTPGDAFFTVVSGELEVTKRSGSSEIPIAQVGAGAIQGEMAAFEGGLRTASVRALGDVEVVRIPFDALRTLLGPGHETAIALLRPIVQRLRSTEAMLREREKLAGLGTLAAGLAHELNNPAAAMRRSVDALSEVVAVAESLPHPTPPPQPPDAPPARLSTLERADRIDALATLTGGDGEAAGALVDDGWTAEALRGQAPQTIAWLAADASVHQLLGEVKMAAERIGEIVSAVKGYAYLDQAPVQRIDVRDGLEQTLVILRHRLKGGVEVRREYADGLPEIEAYGSELNQVWTNIVDNAVDAMDGRGSLLVRTELDGGTDGGVRVTICDSGPGIPSQVRERLFEPFYTTKPPGQGTGLGLHISHQVVSRHGGRIEVASEPGRTCFIVSLAETLPR